MDVPEAMFLEAAQQLKRTVQQGRTFDAAQVKIIGLDDVRRAAGERWPVIKERVRVNSLNFLQAALSEGDIVIPCGDGFLVIYAQDARRNLQSETETLQQALNTFYMGDDALRDVRAKVSQHTLSSHEVAGMLGGEIEIIDPPPQETIRFLPICDVAAEATTSYRAVLTSGSGPHLRVGYNPDYRATGSHEHCDFVERDLALIDKAAAEAVRVKDSPQRCLVGYSVHVTTLKNRAARERIFERLNAIPLPDRKNLISRIAEIDTGTPLFNIIEWVSMLRRFTPHVSLEFHPSERVFEGLEDTRAISAGFYLPLPTTVTADSRARCRALMTRWRLCLHRQRLRFFVDGANDPIILGSAFHEAADFVTSERIWAPGIQTLGMRAINRADVGLLKSA